MCIYHKYQKQSLISKYRTMKRLVEKELFEMLSSDKSTEATDNLIREIMELGDGEEDLVSLFRTLNFTRFHLRTMSEKSGITTEMGKKCGRTALCY